MPTVFAAGAFVPRFGVEPLGTAPQPNARTVPTWGGSFAYNGTTYPYRMVGTDPAAGSTSTTVPTEIVPLRVVFADGAVYDGSAKTDVTVVSPVFETAAFPSDETQYGDAIQRANFWANISTTSPNWHVLLGRPTVLPTQTITVPSGHGMESPAPGNGQTIGLIDQHWFSTRLQNMLGSLHIDPTSLPIFLTYNTFTYTPTQCCTLGFHGASPVAAPNGSGSVNGNGNQKINTYIFAAYMDPNLVPAPFGDIQDVNILSHEVIEWMNDPFITNLVPSWTTALTGYYYGCSPYLEAGDPLVGVDFPVSMAGGMTYHLQDAAFLPWFERSPTSTSLDGNYTYLGTYPSYSPSC